MRQIFLLLIAIFLAFSCSKEEDSGITSPASNKYTFELKTIVGNKALLQIETIDKNNIFESKVYENISYNNPTYIKELTFEFDVSESDKQIRIICSRVSTLSSTKFDYKLISNTNSVIESGNAEIENQPIIINHNL